MYIIPFITVAFVLTINSRTICYANANKRFNSCKRMNVMMKKESTNKLSLLYKPKTENQKDYVNALNQKEDYILTVTGPAGTGKTLLACTTAVENLKQQKIDKIILTRPVVPVEEEIGFLPGTMIKKMDPWTRPIFDIFEEYYTKSELTNMVLNGQIEISPLGFMRGRTFKNAFIIADEMQNSSPNQMFMLLTRIGLNSRMVITGDLEQSDKQENNGLKELMEKINIYGKYNILDKIKLIELNNTDIQRSELVSNIISMYKFKTPVPVPVPIISPLTPNPKPKRPIYINPDTQITNKVSINDDAALIPKKDMLRIASVLPPKKIKE